MTAEPISALAGVEPDRTSSIVPPTLGGTDCEALAAVLPHVFSQPTLYQCGDLEIAMLEHLHMTVPC